MKSIEEIMRAERIADMHVSDDGGIGRIFMPRWSGSVIWSTGGGWDHVSVAPFNSKKTPDWDDMCRLKDIFFGENEAVIQIHPPKGSYVNNVQNCLHLWRPQRQELPLPPSILVGVRDGQTAAEVVKEIADALG